MLSAHKVGLALSVSTLRRCTVQVHTKQEAKAIEGNAILFKEDASRK